MSKRTPAQRAAKVICEYFNCDGSDEIEECADAIRCEFSEREKAVAELVAACLPFTNMGNCHSERLNKAIEAVEGTQQ